MPPKATAYFSSRHREAPCQNTNSDRSFGMQCEIKVVLGSWILHGIDYAHSLLYVECELEISKENGEKRQTTTTTADDNETNTSVSEFFARF